MPDEKEINQGESQAALAIFYFFDGVEACLKHVQLHEQYVCYLKLHV